MHALLCIFLRERALAFGLYKIISFLSFVRIFVIRALISSNMKCAKNIDLKFNNMTLYQSVNLIFHLKDLKERSQIHIRRIIKNLSKVSCWIIKFFYYTNIDQIAQDFDVKKWIINLLVLWCKVFLY